MPDPPTQGKVLIVEDEDFYADAYRARLAGDGYDIERVADTDSALDVFHRFEPDVVLLDLTLRDQDIEGGFSVLAQMHGARGDVRVIVVTASGRTAVAERALRLGASDFVGKEERGYEELQFRVSQAFDRLRLERRIRDQHRESLDRVGGFRYGREGIIVGRSPVMQTLYRQIEQVAPTSTTVLLQGESGTGKELIAQAIHAGSPRGDQRLVALDCGALPQQLIEAELFGYVKGAHSQATEDRQGLFEAAHGSTLFLDEIGELPLSLQTNLLRAIETREIRRLGDTQPVTVDFRLIAATNRDLEAAVASGEFRQDLYFRLNVLTIEAPPLRQRADDIPLICRHFLDRFNDEYGREILGFRPEALEALRRDAWPGNVRELANRMQRAVLFSDGDWLDARSVQATAAATESSGAPDDLMAAYLQKLQAGDSASLPQLLARCEEAVIRQALDLSASQQEAAGRLGMSESRLRGKMDKYGIPRVRAR